MQLREPAASQEKADEPRVHRRHLAKGKRIPLRPIQFRHVPRRGLGVEVYSGQDGDQAERDDQLGDGAQKLHYLIHAITGNCQVEVLQVGTEFAIRFDNVDVLNDVVVAVTKVQVSFVVDQFSGISNQRVDCFS